VQKNRVVTEFSFAKTAGRCITPVAVAKPKNVYFSLKLLRRYTAYQRTVLATTMDAWKVQRATRVTKWQCEKSGKNSESCTSLLPWLQRLDSCAVRNVPCAVTFLFSTQVGDIGLLPVSLAAPTWSNELVVASSLATSGGRGNGCLLFQKTAMMTSCTLSYDDISNDLDRPVFQFSRSRHFWSPISQKRCILGTMCL